MPFNFRDSEQMHTATLAAIAAVAAFTKHVPDPFCGPVEVVLSIDRATGFFHPQMPWNKLLLGPRIVHVLPWTHRELFRSGREEVGRLLKFMLERQHSPDLAARVEKDIRALI